MSGGVRPQLCTGVGSPLATLQPQPGPSDYFTLALLTLTLHIPGFVPTGASSLLCTLLQTHLAPALRFASCGSPGVDIVPQTSYLQWHLASSAGPLTCHSSPVPGRVADACPATLAHLWPRQDSNHLHYPMVCNLIFFHEIWTSALGRELSFQVSFSLDILPWSKVSFKVLFTSL